MERKFCLSQLRNQNFCIESYDSWDWEAVIGCLSVRAILFGVVTRETVTENFHKYLSKIHHFQSNLNFFGEAIFSLIMQALYQKWKLAVKPVYLHCKWMPYHVDHGLNCGWRTKVRYLKKRITALEKEIEKKCMKSSLRLKTCDDLLNSFTNIYVIYW